MLFAKTLIHWYLNNKRDLPWRDDPNPYHVWLSEIILQQTRVEQGLPYYFSFVKEFSSVFELAAAPLEKILKLWQGLGYYSRARNLHTAAQDVVKNHNGVFPVNYKGLLSLKGVGDYTASAIASICYSEPVAVVDGNVYRVLARYFGIETPVNSTEGVKEFKKLATELLDVKSPGTYNQAVMEFGALQCKPQAPDCNSCPLSQGCIALRDKKVNVLPVKLKKGKIKKRFFNYLVFLSPENKTLLEKRIGKGIWEGLYQFPLIETKSPVLARELLQSVAFRDLAGATTNISLYNNEPVIHKLSHQHIYTSFWIVEKQSSPTGAIPVETLEEYPVPVLIANFLNEFEFETY